MTVKQILIFDFDGVIVDGLVEYWASSRKAYSQIIGAKDFVNGSDNEVPEDFKTLRPWIKNGWEMVLLAAEILNPDSSLNILGAKAFSNNFKKNCSEILKKRQWSPDQLQQSLDNARKESIKTDFNAWLKSHKPFPFVVERIKKLNKENIDFGVLTTKSTDFTSQLLDHLNLQPRLLYGHESGEKSKSLLEISKEQTIAGFIEDRRATLEKILRNPDLKFIHCYLASWGYLKPDDKKDLPLGIHFLETRKFTGPLANWF